MEYGDLELVRGIKGGDKGGVRAAGPPLVSAGLWVRDDQGDDLGIRPDSRKRVRAAEAADDGGIRRVEQQLQHTRKNQRQRKQQDFAQQRTAAQVHLVAAFHSLKHFPSCVKFSYCLYYLSEYRWCQWGIVFQGYSWYSEAITEWQIGI